MPISRNKKKRLREDFEKKKVQKKKSLRGQSETGYGECKKISSFSLTPTASLKLGEISKNLGISRSEFLERIARGIIRLEVNSEESS